MKLLVWLENKRIDYALNNTEDKMFNLVHDYSFTFSDNKERCGNCKQCPFRTECTEMNKKYKNELYKRYMQTKDKKAVCYANQMTLWYIYYHEHRDEQFQKVKDDVYILKSLYEKIKESL